jgi:hypothetical protein
VYRIDFTIYKYLGGSKCRSIIRYFKFLNQSHAHVQLGDQSGKLKGECSCRCLPLQAKIVYLRPLEGSVQFSGDLGF